MIYDKYDKKKSEKIKELNEKISKEQQQIFDILLKISRSFSDESFSKEKRNELFSQVDVLKQNIKDYNEKLKEVKLSKSSDLIKEEVESKVSKEDVINAQKKNEEFVDTVQKLEETLKETQLQKENVSKKAKEPEEYTISKRKRARTQLVVVEDDDSLSGKIKEFFSKLRSIIKNK